MKTRQQIKTRLNDIVKTINAKNVEGLNLVELAEFFKLKEIRNTLEWVLDDN